MRKGKRFLFLAVLAAVPFINPVASHATDVPLILNEANTVSGDKFLEYPNGADTGPLLGAIQATGGTGVGRVQGNGQNWLEFVAGPTAGHQSNLSGYKLVWSDFKDAANYSSGTITFNNVSEWQNVSQGALFVVNEWEDVYYSTSFDSGSQAKGEDRNGGKDGFGLTHGSLSGTHLNLHTDLASFNGANGVWTAHIFAGDDGSGGAAVGSGTGSGSSAVGYFFTFTGSQTTAGVTSYIGDTNDASKSAGLFVCNNNDWNLTIEDHLGSPVGPVVGESEPNWQPSGGGKGGVNSQEVLKLEPGQFSTNGYGALTNVDYEGGHSSTEMAVNVWTGGGPEDLSSLRVGSPTHW